MNVVKVNKVVSAKKKNISVNNNEKIVRRIGHELTVILSKIQQFDNTEESDRNHPIALQTVKMAG